MKKNLQILLLNLLVLLCFILGYGRFGDIIINSFREAYIPEQILKGQVLYKDIFTIYAPFAYLFNAFLFKIFGVSLNTLYCAGLFVSLGITNLIYLISKEFFSKNSACIVVFFFICTSILSPNIYNCFFPYSYGMLYGLLFILAGVLFAIKKQYTTAFAFCSLAICSKYEFIFLLPLLIYLSGKNNRTKNLTIFLIPAILTYTPLFIQGVRLEDIFTSFQNILTMNATKTLYWFYSSAGLVFKAELIPIYLVNLIKISIPIVFLYYLRRRYFMPLIAIYCYYISTPEIIIYIFPLILGLFIFRLKKLQQNEIYFIIASLLISLKLFFALNLQSYGIYFIPFAIISILILIPENLRKALLSVLILCGLSIGIKNINSLYSKNIKIETPIGIVYSKSGDSINQLINYINLNTTASDKILIYPEGLAVNFLTQRNSDNKFYSLIPLYIETFGEDAIISRFKITKPEYIIISNYDTSIYYYSHFGVDYATNLYLFILNNYDKQAEIGKRLTFTVFKLRPRHLSEKHV